MIPRSSDTGNVDTFESCTHTNRYVSGANCVQSSQETISVVVSRKRKSFTGFDIENYHARKARGDLLPHTPFTKRTYTLQRSFGTFQEKWKATGCVQNEWNPLPDFQVFDSFNRNVEPEIQEFGIDPAYLVQMAAAAVYGKGWDVGTFIGELSQTIRMFTSLASSVFRRGDEWNKLTDKQLTDAYLQNRYGWRTFVYDLQDFSDAVTRFDRSRKRYSERQGVSASHTDVVTDTPYSSVACTINRTVVTETQLSVRGAITADIQPPQFALNPFVTGWELMRFSFIIDWVIDIGTWLMSLSFLYLSTNYTASHGYKFTRVVTCTLTGANGTDPVNYSYSFAGSSSTSVLEVITRTPTSVSTLPSIVKLPGFDAAKIADLTAIVRKFLNLRR